jgi:hypothetical protein
MAPEHLEVWSCKFCGKEMTTKNYAKNCEGGHLHVDDLAIGRIEQAAGDNFCYTPQSRWPKLLYIKCSTKAIDGKVYRLVDDKPRAGGFIGIIPPTTMTGGR